MTGSPASQITQSDFRLFVTGMAAVLASLLSQIRDVEAVHSRNEGKAASILPVYVDLPCIVYYIHLTF